MTKPPYDLKRELQQLARNSPHIARALKTQGVERMTPTPTHSEFPPCCNKPSS